MRRFWVLLIYSLIGLSDWSHSFLLTATFPYHTVDRHSIHQAPATPLALIDSDIIRLNTLGMNIIVLDTFEVASDLLDKRSAIYSDR